MKINKFRSMGMSKKTKTWAIVVLVLLLAIGGTALGVWSDSNDKVSKFGTAHGRTLYKVNITKDIKAKHKTSWISSAETKNERYIEAKTNAPDNSEVVIYTKYDNGTFINPVIGSTLGGLSLNEVDGMSDKTFNKLNRAVVKDNKVSFYFTPSSVSFDEDTDTDATYKVFAVTNFNSYNADKATVKGLIKTYNDNMPDYFVDKSGKLSY